MSKDSSLNVNSLELVGLCCEDADSQMNFKKIIKPLKVLKVEVKVILSAFWAIFLLKLIASEVREEEEKF